MKIGILRLYTGESGGKGFYNMQELGIAKALTKNKGIEVLIFILRDKKKYNDVLVDNVNEKIKIVYLPAISIGGHGIINPRFIKKFNIDVLQLNSDNQINTFRIIRWCLKNEVPIFTLIGTIKSDSTSLIKRFISNIVFNINKIYQQKIINVAKNQCVYDCLKSNGIKNIKIIPIGLDLDTIELPSNYDMYKLREKYNLSSEKKVLLFVGRLEEYKNPKMAIELLKYINDNGENFQLMIVGNGQLRDELFKIIEAYGLKDKVHYIEKIENGKIFELYRLSDVFINMNDKEIFGMSILEAMYYKCPVVAVKAPGPNYVIENNKTGFLVDGFNLNQWLLTVKKAVELKEKIGVNANESIIKNFNWNVIAEKYINLYKEIADRTYSR